MLNGKLCTQPSALLRIWGVDSVFVNSRKITQMRGNIRKQEIAPPIRRKYVIDTELF